MIDMRRVLLILCLSTACEKATVEKPSGEHEGGGHEGGEEGGHAEGGEVHLTADAVERAGIITGKAERRALMGGVAIPAEVEFDPSGTAHVGPLLPGRFTAVKAALGDRVERGQLLATLASGDASSSRSQLQQARARLAAAQVTLDRQRQLVSEGIGAQRSLVEAEAEVGQLTAEIEGLRRQLSAFGSGRGGELRLVSPIDGVVVTVDATLGENATTEQAAFVVTDPDKIWIRGNVPELEVGRIQSGGAALVRFHAYDDLALTGKITYVAPALDTVTRALPVRVTLDAPDSRLRSGLFATIELTGSKPDERHVAVPAEAVATVDGQSVVFAPGDEPNSFVPVAIRLGRRAGAFFEVESGLEEGTEIVLRGAFTLKSALKSGELSEGHAH